MKNNQNRKDEKTNYRNIVKAIEELERLISFTNNKNN